MDIRRAWSRRRFLARSAASIAATQLPHRARPQVSNAIPPPTVITGAVKPLLSGQTARPLRYQPEGTAFLIRNGSEFFNRPLYGPVSSFRIDAGDRPEFSLYLPGHGGNLKVGFLTATGAKWAANADQVLARYQPGRMIYEIRDPKLGRGTLLLELCTAPYGSGLLLKIEARGIDPRTSIAWAFGGVSGRNGRRNGDIGCEVEPVARFFQLRPEECAHNDYTLETSPTTNRPSARLQSPSADLLLTFPPGARLDLQEFSAWDAAPALHDQRAPATPQLPLLTGSCPAPAQPVYLAIRRLLPNQPAPEPTHDPAAEFESRRNQLATLAGTLRFDTPDPFLNAAAPALAVVAEALWDPSQQCVMHGSVAWRIPLAGWRGPYILDALGQHERARLHLRHWLQHQNLTPIPTADPATGPADPNTHLARKEALLHSNGDLSNNHYDMNLVFFDVLLRHLRWTGDLAFAREIWPAFKRHLAWEHRLFRRAFANGLPLYEAYAAIWASDNLQYSGGGATHSSAYLLFALRLATTLARLLHEDPTPYESEANLLHQAMQQLLWLPNQGTFAESKDLLGPQTTYTNPALWTLYHTIDSEVPTPRQSWQMIAERLATLKRIPIEGPGVPTGAWYMLACSNWLPYMWSLNLLALAENAHMALAMWQAGMPGEAWLLLQGSLLDSMYMGLCPGNLHLTSALDPHRQEAQRDFGDPAGITARALIEGLFGIQPDLLRSTLRLRPGFPASWNHASLKDRDFDLAWKRDGLSETLTFTSRLPHQVPVTLLLPARTTSLPQVTNQGTRVPCTFDPEAVGTPTLRINLPAASTYSLTLTWQGEPPVQPPPQRTYPLNAPLQLPSNLLSAQLEDPQHCLTEGRTTTPGFHTVFAPMHQADCTWTLPISFTVTPGTPAFLPIPHLAAASTPHPLDLTPLLTHHLPDILTRAYTSPRSPLCTLAVPDTLLGGWANIGGPLKIDDTGLRSAGGTLATPLGVPFRTPAGDAPNCLFLSHFHPDHPTTQLPLTGHAQGLYLLVTGTTLPQCSRMQHALLTVTYTDGTAGTLSLRNPETWWPIEQDYLLDDFLFVNEAPLPPRVDLRTGQTRLLTPETFKGKGDATPTGQATILHLALDPTRTLTSLTLHVDLYNIVVALLAVTLVRPA